MTTAKSVEFALRNEFSLPDDEATVSNDKFGGYRIRVISASFAKVPHAERRERVFRHVDDDDIASLVLMTPDEAEVEPSPEPDPATKSLPLWPDSLADGACSEFSTVHLASEDLEPLTRPVTATFYSLRGGVGRSTALAQTAFSLSELGLSVLCIDMDLEAPGLATMLGVDDQLHESRGVVRLLTHIEIMAEVPRDLADHFVRVETTSGAQRVELLPAGKIGPRYAQDLALIDPAAWFEEEVNPLRLLLEGVRNLDPVVRPDVVLIDSRTGLSPISAPLLFETADIDVITFLPHPQTKTGTGMLTRALLTAQTMRGRLEGRKRTPEPRFIVSPVPPSEENFTRAHRRALGWISEWLSPARDPEGNRPFDDLEEIVQVISYSEDAATSDAVRPAGSRVAYRPIAEWIAGMVESDSGRESDHGSNADESEPKAVVLESLSFDTQTADDRRPEDLDNIFVSTDSVRDALDQERRLVIGRKGSGKTLLFRRLVFDEDVASAAVTAPSSEDGTAILPLSQALYQQLHREIKNNQLSWQSAWRALIGLSARRQMGERIPVGVSGLAVDAQSYRGGELLNDVRALLQQSDADIALEDWLAEVDEGLEEPLYLLFDGLDTGFGTEFGTRSEAVVGLLLLLNGQAKNFRNLRFKVFLREDIFRAADLPNKSHLRAEAVTLAWNNQYDYLRLVIKQAWRSMPFRRLVLARLGDRSGSYRAPVFDFERTSIEFWPNNVVLDVWQILVGDRMSGGKTAFTHNWVWTRLADANEDHAPRHLIALFENATANERRFEPGAPNSRVLIRPKALNDALDEASAGAEEAIHEEYPELRHILNYLRDSIGKTPFEARELLDNDDIAPMINLASEVGLIGRGSDDRFRVPELYRRALGMNRQGQQ